MISDLIIGNSSELMLQAGILHFPPPPRGRRLRVADVTYGLGVFWRQIDVAEFDFFPSDLRTVPGRSFDFRNLPYADGFLDVAVIDPPYGAHRMYRFGRDRYGAKTIDRFRSPTDIIQLYRYGMAELHRCLCPNGLLFVKCQDGIAGGKQHRYT